MTHNRSIKTLVLLLLLAVAGSDVYAQAKPTADNDTSSAASMPEGIIYDTGEEADSILRYKVYRFERSRRSVKLYSISHPSLNPTGIHLSNPSQRMDGQYYLDRGELGQTQLSLFPFSKTDNSTTFHLFRFCTDNNPVYRQELHRENLFQTQTPYTLLSYGSSMNKDYQVSIIHTQNLKPRWNIAFIYDLVSRDGLYTNSEVTNHIVNATTNYYSADARYQLQGGISFNRIRQQENGGVQNDTTCWGYSRESGVPVNMYAAQNQWRDLTVWVHQSYNTVRQFEYLRPIMDKAVDTVKMGDGAISYQTRDTIIGYDTLQPREPHTYNSGVFAWDFEFGRHRRIFSDNQADSWFYNYADRDTSFLYDSTMQYSIVSELYWTNDAYMSHRWQNPLCLYFGVRPEFNTLRFASDTTIDSGLKEVNISPFAKAVLNIGIFRLAANAQTVTGGRRNGDYQMNADLSLNNIHLTLLSEAKAPDLIFYHNEGCHSWNYDNNSFRKIKRQRIAMEYSMHRADTTEGMMRHLVIDAGATLLSNNVWITSSMRPMQGDGTGMLLQARAATHLRIGWFNIRLQEMVQYSSDENVIRVPIFASKNSIYADVHVFKRALHLQTGIDIRYHTLYYADGWNPVLGAFYRQDEQKVGNYFVADAWVNLQIKRASIYLKASHFNAPIADLLTLTPHYFSLPHYPMEGLGVYWGITWKFFN